MAALIWRCTQIPYFQLRSSDALPSPTSLDSLRRRTRSANFLTNHHQIRCTASCGHLECTLTKTLPRLLAFVFPGLLCALNTKIGAVFRRSPPSNILLSSVCVSHLPLCVPITLSSLAFPIPPILAHWDIKERFFDVHCTYLTRYAFWLIELIRFPQSLSRYTDCAL